MPTSGHLFHVMRLFNQQSCQSFARTWQTNRAFSSGPVHADAEWKKKVQWDRCHSAEGPRTRFTQSNSSIESDASADLQISSTSQQPTESGTAKWPKVESDYEKAALTAITEWAKVQEENETLSLPPFLRTRFEKRLKVGADYGGVRAKGNRRSERLNRKYAPFAARFHNNVYAKMLAEPIREERVTNARVPRACLLSFHVVDGNEPTEAGEVEKSLQTNRQRPLQLQFYPRTLFAELVHKKSLWKESEEKRELARMLALERTEFKDAGPATYLLANYDFLDALSQIPKLIPKLAVQATRDAVVNKHGRSAHIGWSKDTPELVLQTMRLVLWKKMAYLLQAKTSAAEKPGLIQALLPRSDGTLMSRLKHIPNAMALVRLQPAPDGTPTAAEAYKRKRQQWHELKKAEGSELETSSGIESQPDWPSDEESETQSFDGKAADARLMAFFQVKESAASENLAGEPDSAYWTSEEPSAEVDESEHFDNEGFLTDLKPLPPPTKPSHVYYPTVQYWNRKLPMYSLPSLLGEDMAKKMIESTVFKDAEYITIQAHGGTMSTLEWLWKLHTFIGREKSESPRI